MHVFVYACMSDLWELTCIYATETLSYIQVKYSHTELKCIYTQEYLVRFYWPQRGQIYFLHELELLFCPQQKTKSKNASKHQ